MTMQLLSLADFRRKFSADVDALPWNVCLIGWSPRDQAWSVGPSRLEHRRWFRTDRLKHCQGTFRRWLPVLLKFLDGYVVEGKRQELFWFAFCFYDGWRERIGFSPDYRPVVPTWRTASMIEWVGQPGEYPVFSVRQPWVVCYCAHEGDPSAWLWPEGHFLERNHYRDMFAEVAQAVRPWAQRQARAIFCAGNHGEVTNFLPPLVPGRPHPRAWLAQVVAREGLAMDVHLGERISRAHQMGYRYLLDVDGYSRTWDAWAWKLMSGSVVLSPASPWQGFFTRQFQRWVHYVPVANDFSDLGERLQWCRDNDAECEAIARRAGERAAEVYTPEFAAGQLRTEWARRFSTPGAV